MTTENPTSALLRIVQEIQNERTYQDGKWGTAFDDANTLNDWVTYIALYAGKGADMSANPMEQRKRILQVATIAVAAVQAFDRNGGFAPRHYEGRVPT